MENKKLKVGNVPPLRFPGFEGEWETKKLGEVATNKSEKYNPANKKDSIKCIEMEHLATETGQLLGYIDGSKSGSIKNVFNEGDILFGKLRPYLKKYLQAPFNGVCSSEIWVLKGKKISNAFLYRIIQTKSFIDLANQSSGSKMPRADWNVLENGFFSIPSLSEQNKIASFLSLLDERISTQNKIIEELKLLKNTLSKKIFSAQLKFKDINGKNFPKWQIKKLGEIGNFQTSSIDKLSRENEKKVFLVNYMNVYRHENINKETIKSFQTVTAKDFQIESCNLKIGDILFTPSSETPDDIGHSVVIFEDLQNTVFSYHLMRFRPKTELDILYSHYFCNIPSVLNQISKLATGSTRFTISIKSFSKIEVSLPCKAEQHIIASFLSRIDLKIEAEIKILQKLKKQKMYLLTNLFI